MKVSKKLSIVMAVVVVVSLPLIFVAVRLFSTPSGDCPLIRELDSPTPSVNLAALTTKIKTEACLYVRLQLDFGRDVGQNLGTLFEAFDEDGNVISGAGFNGASQSRRVVNNRYLEFYCRSQGGPPVIEDISKPVPRSVRPSLAVVGQTLVDLGTQSILSTGGWQEYFHKDMSVYNIQMVRNKPLYFAYGDGMTSVFYDGSLIVSLPGDPRCCIFGGNEIYVLSKDSKTHAVLLRRVRWNPYDDRLSASRHVSTIQLPVGDTPSRADMYAMFWHKGKLLVAGGTGQRAVLFEVDGTKVTKVKYDEETEKYVSKEGSGEFYAFIAYFDKLYLGHYPSGFLYQYNGNELKKIADFPPPRPGQWRKRNRDGNVFYYREAQSLCWYRGDLCVGMYPWGHVWRLDRNTGRWDNLRLFNYPRFSSAMHPYRNEYAARTGHRKNGHKTVKKPISMWSQRICSLIPFNGAVAAGLGKMRPYQYDSDSDTFITERELREYGSVKLLRSPYSVMGQIEWTDKATQLEFVGSKEGLFVIQDGKTLSCVRSNIEESLWKKIRRVEFGNGAYGRLGGTILEKVHTIGQQTKSP